jgi:hypothetical protein
MITEDPFLHAARAAAQAPNPPPIMMMSLFNSDPKGLLRVEALAALQPKELIVPALRMPHCLINLLLNMAFNTSFMVINSFAMEQFHCKAIEWVSSYL